MSEYRNAFNATVDMMHERPACLDWKLETMLENAKKTPEEPRSKGVLDCIRQFDILKRIPELIR